jgi:hypothetical protein
MAGRGPAPKPAHRKAGRSGTSQPQTVITVDPAEQPAFPATRPDGSEWPAQTVEWWAMWGRSPLSALFTETDWSELLDTALLHARLWSGEVSIAPELRLRVAKFGATPEDRARLRITFASADEADAKRPKPEKSRERYGDLQVVAEAS